MPRMGAAVINSTTVPVIAFCSRANRCAKQAGRHLAGLACCYHCLCNILVMIKAKKKVCPDLQTLHCNNLTVMLKLCKQFGVLVCGFFITDSYSMLSAQVAGI